MGKNDIRKKANPGKVKQFQIHGDHSIESVERIKRLEWIFMELLLAAGIYLSIAYFGQKAVPNSDFTAFVQTGDEILHFRIPSSFKRVPLLGILQITVSRFIFNSPYPILTGALVLNGILYTLSILLFYKISRFFIAPTGSFCLSLLASLNPWALAMVVDPIAETAIVFFVLLTLYLIFLRSRWCYLAAMLASMVRHECFGLIVIALLFDLFDRQPKRQRLIAFGLAFLAAVPMLLWMIGTKVMTTNPDTTYFKHFLNVTHRNGFDFLKMLWTTSFSSLLQWPGWIRAMLVERPTTQQAADAVRSQNDLLGFIWNMGTTGLFAAGVVGVFVKKQWRFLGILLFWAGYAGIHMSQSVLIDRYTLPAVWLTLLTAAFGLSAVAAFLAARIPRGILMAAAVIGAIFAFGFTLQLWPAIKTTARISSASGSVVYVGLLLAAIGLVSRQILCRGKNAWSEGCLFIMIALMIVSNQFSLAFHLGNGDTDIEFKRLAEWYLQNTQRNEKMVTTLPGVVNLFLPENHKNAIHTGNIAGKNPAEFAQNCRQQQIVYVAWDSRLGFAVKDSYYQGWGLAKIHPLGGGKDVGPFLFVTKIEASKQRYINLYRLDYNLMKEFGL
ncbi:MAG: hypothetical protein FJ263_04775 [Planctomycetes bacterium]|nr:hypothetical protein [Planctomycetota bacterium]